MRYGIQTAVNEQTTLFVEEQTNQRKRASVPIYRVTLVREGKMPTYESRIRSSANAYTVFQEYLDGVDREHFVAMLLDQKNQLIGLHTVSIGSLTASIVAPREVFKVAILANCANILIAHIVGGEGRYFSFADENML